jgi:hypothetical protein
VEGSIAFGAATYQHFGIVTNFGDAAGNYWAIFSTAGTTNTLFARVDANGTTQDVNLGPLPSGFHDYLIHPVTGGFQFLVDGVLQTTISISFPSGLAVKIGLSAFSGSPQPALQADWVRVDNYPASGTFTSAVFDAGHLASWGVASWTATVPAGTTLTVLARTGNTATPDTTWTGWTTLTSGGTVGTSGRYIQYEVKLTTTDPTVTPTLFDITFNFT